MQKDIIDSAELLITSTPCGLPGGLNVPSAGGSEDRKQYQDTCCVQKSAEIRTGLLIACSNKAIRISVIFCLGSEDHKGTCCVLS